MSAESVRSSSTLAEHRLPALAYEGELLDLRVFVRREQDGAWRGTIVFGGGDLDEAVSTAEILYGVNESEFWHSVRDLREHHLRDLYRSLTE